MAEPFYCRYPEDPPAPDPNDWSPKRLIPETGVGMLVGPSCGKNFLALDLGRAIATGKPFFGVKLHARGGAAFLLSSGKAACFPLRIAALSEPLPLAIMWKAWHDLIPSPPFGAPPLADLLDALAENLTAAQKLMSQRHNAPLRLVVIDSMAMCGLLPPDDDGAARGRALVGSLRALARRLGIFVLLVNWCPDERLGRLDWPAMSAMKTEADLVLEVAKGRAKRSGQVAAQRGPHSARRALGAYKLRIVNLGRDADGEAVTSCAIAATGLSDGRTWPRFR